MTVHPCNLRGGDVFGAYQAREFVEKHRPEVVFLVNDLWILGKYARVLSGLRTRIVCYCPLDGKIADDSLIEPLAAFDRLVVYTRFARREFERAAGRGGFSLPDATIIPHGVDTDVFRPLSKEERLAARRNLLPNEAHEPFIVLNANRPQPRKRVDLTIEGFALFARSKPPNVKLCLHHAVANPEERQEILRLAEFHGISERLIVSDAPATDEKLNEIYNASDVGINTAMGEGWGLVSFEHAATGAAQIVPRHSACAELWKDAAEFLEPANTLVPDFSILEMQTVSPKGIAAALERLYVDHEYRREMSRAAFRNATRPEYRWDEISRRWRRLFDEVAKARGTHPCV
ncbi:MAG: glycosyltransferase family 4 protein [Rubrobacteraceae bacterium]